MRVTLTFDEEDIEPLIQIHLQAGASVQNQIIAALQTWNKMTEFRNTGHDIAAGKEERGYFNSRTVILKALKKEN